MTDVSSVTTLLREEVTMEVPFAPAVTRWQRVLRRLRRAVRGSRPVKYTFVFQEASAADVIRYMELTAKVAQQVINRQAREVNGGSDFLTVLVENLDSVRLEVDSATGIYEFITGIHDPEFWAVIPPRQRNMLSEAYDRVNPVLLEAKKKLQVGAANAGLILSPPPSTQLDLVTESTLPT